MGSAFLSFAIIRQREQLAVARSLQVAQALLFIVVTTGQRNTLVCGQRWSVSHEVSSPSIIHGQAEVRDLGSMAARRKKSPQNQRAAAMQAVVTDALELVPSTEGRTRRELVFHDHPSPGKRMQSMLPRGDKQFLETPWYGSRQMARHMQRQGHECGRHRVRRLMWIMRLVPIYQTPNTSKKHPQHKIYPYLLRRLTIDRPNQVWCVDITYIPLTADCLAIARRAMDAAGVPVSGGSHGLVQP